MIGCAPREKTVCTWLRILVCVFLNCTFWIMIGLCKGWSTSHYYNLSDKSSNVPWSENGMRSMLPKSMHTRSVDTNYAYQMANFWLMATSNIGTAWHIELLRVIITRGKLRRLIYWLCVSNYCTFCRMTSRPQSQSQKPRAVRHVDPMRSTMSEMSKVCNGDL